MGFHVSLVSSIPRDPLELAVAHSPSFTVCEFKFVGGRGGGKCFPRRFSCHTREPVHKQFLGGFQSITRDAALRGAESSGLLATEESTENGSEE